MSALPAATVSNFRAITWCRLSLMTCIFAGLCHGAVHRLGNAVARRVGAKTAHESAFRGHQVKIGAVVHDVVFRARSYLTRCVVNSIFLGNGSDLLRRAREPDDPWIK